MSCTEHVSEVQDVENSSAYHFWNHLIVEHRRYGSAGKKPQENTKHGTASNDSLKGRNRVYPTGWDGFRSLFAWSPAPAKHKRCFAVVKNKKLSV